MSLAGKLLVSLPTIKQGVFAKSVVFIHSVDEDGSVGFILNRRYPPSKAHFICEQLKLPDPKKIFFGGPVGTQSGFVLHSDDYHNKETVQLSDQVLFTPGKAVIKDMQDPNKCPSEYMVILGHSSWAPFQLNAEMTGQPPFEHPQWVTADIDHEYFYGQLDAIQAWDKALRRTAKERSNFLLDFDQ